MTDQTRTSDHQHQPSFAAVTGRDEPDLTRSHLHVAMRPARTVDRDVSLAHLKRVRDELAAVRARWQTNAELGRLSTFAGCAADLDDVLATCEQSLRTLATAAEGSR